MTSSASGRTFGRNSNLANIGGRSEISRATSALAWASVTPGFSRASAWNPKLIWRGALASSGIGSTISGRVRRNVNDAGSTPMTSAGLPSIASVWPTTFSAPPNRRCQ